MLPHPVSVKVITELDGRPQASGCPRPLIRTGSAAQQAASLSPGPGFYLPPPLPQATRGHAVMCVWHQCLFLMTQNVEEWNRNVLKYCIIKCNSLYNTVIILISVYLWYILRVESSCAITTYSFRNEYFKIPCPAFRSGLIAVSGTYHTKKCTMVQFQFFNQHMYDFLMTSFYPTQPLPLPPILR